MFFIANTLFLSGVDNKIIINKKKTHTLLPTKNKMMVVETAALNLFYFVYLLFALFPSTFTSIMTDLLSKRVEDNHVMVHTAIHRIRQDAATFRKM